jgi:uncharacterized protein involved in exopolysaccharide biosynthesis
MNDTAASVDGNDEDQGSGPSALDLMIALLQRWRLLVGGSFAASLVALGVVFVIPPTYTAITTFLPPQQQQGIGSAALGQLGALVGLAGGAGASLKTPADQYVALMQSVTVSDRLIDRFGLMAVYDVEYRYEARRELADNVNIVAGRKDGLIRVEVQDHDAKRATDIANQYVAELQLTTSQLALTEAQQRRVFFDGQLRETNKRLVGAQVALESSGFNPGALKTEPRAAVENYARLQAETTAAEVRLQTMRSRLADSAPEVAQQQSLLAALRSQLARSEAGSKNQGGGPDYVGKYREFKYQEALFELYAKQFELARMDESREGALIQVVDVARQPERRSSPRRGIIVLGVAAASFVLLALWVVIGAALRDRAAVDPELARRLALLRNAWRGR